MFLPESDAQVERMLQGGLGKTTVSCWLIRQTQIREQFQKIAWITFGQRPNIGSAQSTLHLQLTGSPLAEDLSSDERKIHLQHAMRKFKVLLVLDDCWDSEHEAAVNCIHAENGSKVLVSSRNRTVLENDASIAVSQEHTCTSIVELSTPNEKEAVEMLFSAAGMVVGENVPAEAVEIVNLCKMLPLVIAIAAKLLKELGLESGHDWAGVVDILREEFTQEDSTQSVEVSVIAASLDHITGPHKHSVSQLFKSLALAPEDVRIPVDVQTMMYDAATTGDTSGSRAPSLLSVRRW